jgi:two-component system chemotaxis sensor kinase CheA
MVFDDLQQFKETYIIECMELLADMEARLMHLDDGESDSELLNAIFRCAHSIKGGAGAFGFTAIAHFTHVLEALLEKVRAGEVATSRPVIDTLLKSRDIVLHLVLSARDGVTVAQDYGKEVAAELARLCDMPTEKAATSVSKAEAVVAGMAAYTIHFVPQREMIAHGSEPLLLLRELGRMGECNIRCDYSSVPPLEILDVEQCYLRWHISLRTDKGEAAIREVFEFVDGECDLTISAEAREPEKTEVVAEVARVEAALPDTQKAGGESQKGVTSIRVDIDKVDRLINMVGEMVIIQAMFFMQARELSTQSSQSEELMRGIDELTAHTRELQEAVMAVRMQPVKSIFSRMPRLVRDLSSQLGKDIRLQVVGENTEVDKTIIEQLSDPLTHMLRNSVDHGVEMPQARVAAGKPATGNIYLSASHRGGRIVIEVRDDGAGIRRDKVLAKAKERGVVPKEANLSDTEIDQLIFAPGFSTAEAVTSISGRGVGMDVVKRNIEGIGGSVMLVNTPGQGTQFLISLPLTLAILDGMIVRVAGERYIIPIANILETLRPRTQDLCNMADGQTVINIRGTIVPVLYVNRLFGIGPAVEDMSNALIVLVENGHEQIGLLVDELVGQQQVVIKTLEDNTDAVAGVAGATILGDGRVSLILDIAGLRRMQPQKPSRLAA